MNDNMKRWMLFFLVSFPLVLFFSMRQQQQQQQRLKEAAAAHQRALIEQQANAPAEAPRPGATPGTVGTVAGPTSGTLAMRPRVEEPVPADEVGREVVVETGTFRVVFNTAGAVPHSWQIVDKQFAHVAQADIDEAVKLGRPAPKMGDFQPLELIPNYAGIDPHRDYPLMVVLRETGARYLDAFNHRVYSVDGPRAAADGTSATVVTFTSPVTAEGLRLVKTFKFPANGYLVDMEVRLENTAAPGAGQNIAFTEAAQPGLGILWGPGLGKSHTTDKWESGLQKVVAYNGDEVQSVHFANWADAAKPDKQVETEWPERNPKQPWKWGMLDSRFYMATVVPQEGSPKVVALVKAQHVPASAEAQKDMMSPSTLEVFGEPFKIGPGEIHSRRYTLFVGPKKYSLLSSIDKQTQLNLQRVMFQSDWWLSDHIIRPLAIFMLWMLGQFRNLTGSYGWAIILVVLVMRLLSQPFTHMGMKSQARVMAEQQRIKPLIDAINEKFKDDPQKRSAEIWKTYREHGVNPLGMLKGCGWMLIQMPIFFALYRLLAGAIDLRGQGFLWIHDLTAPDALFTLPFVLPWIGNKLNILPVLMGLSQVFAQRLQTTNVQDPTQKQMATLMPIMFTFMLYNFAAGLSLYWFVSNIWQIIFQVFVNKKVREEAEKRAHKAFEARQQAIAAGVPLATGAAKRKAAGKPSWRDRLMQNLEAKAKEAEAMRKQREGGKK